MNTATDEMQKKLKVLSEQLRSTETALQQRTQELALANRRVSDLQQTRCVLFRSCSIGGGARRASMLRAQTALLYRVLEQFCHLVMLRILLLSSGFPLSSPRPNSIIHVTSTPHLTVQTSARVLPCLHPEALAVDNRPPRRFRR